MKQGDLVRIREAWCDKPQDRDIVYVIKEIDDLRASISPVEWEYRLVPTERVEIGMIEPASHEDSK